MVLLKGEDLSQIKVSYVNHMGNDLTTVNAARISFANESQELTEKDKKLINYLAKNEHMSPFEHNALTVIVECPLYIRSQIHRHRTFSYNEVSRRYTSEDLTFYLPRQFRQQAKSNRQASEGTLTPALNIAVQSDVLNHHRESLALYNDLINNGVCREQARGILPQDLMTKFYMTGNLRNWAHFVKLRIDSHAQGEVQEVGQQCKAILEKHWPVAMEALLNE